MPPSRDDGGVERRQSWRTASQIAFVAWRCTRMSRKSWRAGFHSGCRLRAYALSAELNTIASARTLAECIAYPSRIARVAWHPSQHSATASQVRRPSEKDCAGESRLKQKSKQKT